MDTEGLAAICNGLGEREEGDDGVLRGYIKSDHCLDNLKDLQRFLRRDDPQGRHVFKQLCKWNTVSRDLIPLMEHYQHDSNLLINAVKILVFLTMPIDPSSDDVAQQSEHLWLLKDAIARNVPIAAIVSLLEDPLEHLELEAFTEDDWKLVQLVLTLFRNILAIQDILVWQKASGSSTQFLDLRERFLELLFHENVMDVILVLSQHCNGSCGYLRQDNLLLLEIFHHIFQGQDPELIAKASQKHLEVDGGIVTCVDSLRSIMEEEQEKRRLSRLRNLECNSQFSGIFASIAVDGSKTVVKGNPATAFGNNLLKAHKILRGPLKRIAWDCESLSIPKENILELLYNFLSQFLSGGYNVLMQSIREEIEKEHPAIQNSDVIVFFQVACFVTAFQHFKFAISKRSEMDTVTSEASLRSHVAEGSLFQGDICGPIAATMNEAMFFLVMSKWQYAVDTLKEIKDFKSLSSAGSLMKNMICMLDLVLKSLPEDLNEHQIARILLYKIFYDQTDQGMTQFLLNLIKTFDTQKQPKSDLADLVQIIHIIFRLMENLQEHGTLRVSKKSRKGRKKKVPRDKNEVEAERAAEEHGDNQNANNLSHEIGRSTSESVADLNKPVEEHSNNSISLAKENGFSILSSIEDTDMPQMDVDCCTHDSVHINTKKTCDDINGISYEAGDSSDDEHQPATNEVDFNVYKLVNSFANNASIQNICWLLKFYKSNSARTNHYIVCILQRICDDLELSPMLYQLSVVTIFYDILAEQKTNKSKEYVNIVHFLTKLVRKMLKKMKRQPLLFVEILFWKTRKECQFINAEALTHNLHNLKKDIRNLGFEGEMPDSMQRTGGRNITDALGEDEADFINSDNISSQKEEISEGKRKETVSEFYDVTSEGNINLSNHHSSQRRKRIQAISKEQEVMVKALFEQFKYHKRCSYMIAHALDTENTYTAAQVSRKLKQLGLVVPRKEKSPQVTMQPGDGVSNREEKSDDQTLLALVGRSKRKKSKSLCKEDTATNMSKHKPEVTMLHGNDSDVLRSKSKKRKTLDTEVTMTDISEDETEVTTVQGDGSYNESARIMVMPLVKNRVEA